MKTTQVLLIFVIFCFCVVGEITSADLIQPIDPANSFDNAYQQNPSMNLGLQIPKPNEGRMNPNDALPIQHPNQQYPINEHFNQKKPLYDPPNQQYQPAIPSNQQHLPDDGMNQHNPPY